MRLITVLLVLLWRASLALAMPEYGEVVAQVFVLTSFILWISVTVGATGLTVQNIWVDCTDKEQLEAIKNPTPGNILQRLGLPYPLAPDSSVRRGGSGTEKPRVWPPFASTANDLRKLVLLDVIWNPRNLILIFACCCLQVSCRFGVAFTRAH